MPDDTGHKCSCGQPEVSILLVGESQQGKSTFVKSLLIYAGLEDETAKIVVGDYNASATLEPRVFQFRIGIETHTILDDDGKVIDLDLDGPKPADLDDWDDFEFESSVFGKRHLHLRLIDTPGLDDSKNIISTAPSEKSTNMPWVDQVKVVDAKHKLSILREMYEAKFLNGVCVVLNAKEPLKGSTLQTLRGLTEMIKSANLGDSYHFVHTHVDSEHLFSESVRNRQLQLARDIGLTDNKASHHLVNSVMDRFSPLNQHLTKYFISQFLTKISSAPAQTVGPLVFPKQPGHKLMDRELVQIVDGEQMRLSETISKHKTKMSRLNQQKKDAGREASEAKDTYLLAKAERSEWDTEELVVVGSDRKEANAGILGHVLELRATSSCRIRDWEYTNCSNSSWSQKQQVAFPWTRSMFGILEHRRLLRNMWGRITLKGYKRDYYKSTVEAKQQIENEALRAWKEKFDNEERIGRDIEAEENAVAAIEARLQAWEEKKAIFALQSIELFNPNQTATGLEANLATSSIMCYAIGYGKLSATPIAMKDSVPAQSSLLEVSRNPNLDSELMTAWNRLWSKQAELESNKVEKGRNAVHIALCRERAEGRRMAETYDMSLIQSLLERTGVLNMELARKYHPDMTRSQLAAIQKDESLRQVFWDRIFDNEKAESDRRQVRQTQLEEEVSPLLREAERAAVLRTICSAGPRPVHLGLIAAARNVDMKEPIASQMMLHIDEAMDLAKAGQKFTLVRQLLIPDFDPAQVRKIAAAEKAGDDDGCIVM